MNTLTWRSVACVATLIGLGACASAASKVQPAKEVESGYEAASTQIAVLAIAPWQDVSAALNPNFQLTGDQALTKTLATTQLFSGQMIDALNASLAAGLPTSTTSSSETTSFSTEKPEPQNSFTQTTAKATGTAPASSSAPAVTKPGAPGSLSTFMPATEAGIQYATAASLFQEVQLLNRQTQMPMLRKNYRPYLVRLQVTVLPNARAMPYDTYADISFMAPHPDVVPASGMDGSAPSPIVVPLLVTDVAEQSLQNRAAEVLRQLSLNLTGQVNGAGLAGGFGRTKDDLAQAIGADINAVSTVARVNDNTLRVRLGAVNTGSSRFAMVPRANVVTLLLLVPKAKALNFEPAEIPVVMHTWFRDARTGAKLPAVGATYNAQTVESLREILAKFRITGGFKSYCDQYDRTVPVDPNLTEWISDSARLCLRDTKSKALNPANAEEWAGQFMYQLAPFTSEGDFKHFKQNLSAVGINKSVDLIWVNSVHLFGSTGDSSASAFLPAFSSPRLPPSQQALLLDDGSVQASAILTGAKGLRADQISADLVTSGGTSVTLQATSIQTAGANLVVGFPSPKAWELPSGTPPTLQGTITVRALNTEGEIADCTAPTAPPPAPPAAGEPPTECAVQFPVSYRQKPSDPPLAFAITTTVNTVAIQEKGLGTYTFAVKRNPAVPADKAETILRANDAVIDSVANATADAATYSWKINGDGLVTLSLSQLIPGQKFSIALSSKNGATKTIALEAKVQDASKAEKEGK